MRRAAEEMLAELVGPFVADAVTQEREAIRERLSTLQATVESRTAGEFDPTACRVGLRYAGELREFSEWLRARGEDGAK